MKFLTKKKDRLNNKISLKQKGGAAAALAAARSGRVAYDPKPAPSKPEFISDPNPYEEYLNKKMLEERALKEIPPPKTVEAPAPPPLPPGTVAPGTVSASKGGELQDIVRSQALFKIRKKTDYAEQYLQDRLNVFKNNEAIIGGDTSEAEAKAKLDAYLSQQREVDSPFKLPNLIDPDILRHVSKNNSQLDELIDNSKLTIINAHGCSNNRHGFSIVPANTILCTLVPLENSLVRSFYKHHFNTVMGTLSRLTPPEFRQIFKDRYCSRYYESKTITDLFSDGLNLNCFKDSLWYYPGDRVSDLCLSASFKDLFYYKDNDEKEEEVIYKKFDSFLNKQPYDVFLDTDKKTVVYEKNNGIFNVLTSNYNRSYKKIIEIEDRLTLDSSELILNNLADDYDEIKNDNALETIFALPPVPDGIRLIILITCRPILNLKYYEVDMMLQHEMIMYHRNNITQDKIYHFPNPTEIYALCCSSFEDIFTRKDFNKIRHRRHMYLKQEAAHLLNLRNKYNDNISLEPNDYLYLSSLPFVKIMNFLEVLIGNEKGLIPGAEFKYHIYQLIVHSFSKSKLFAIRIYNICTYINRRTDFLHFVPFSKLTHDIEKLPKYIEVFNDVLRNVMDKVMYSEINWKGIPLSDLVSIFTSFSQASGKLINAQRTLRKHKSKTKILDFFTYDYDFSDLDKIKHITRLNICVSYINIDDLNKFRSLKNLYVNNCFNDEPISEENIYFDGSRCYNHNIQLIFFYNTLRINFQTLEYFTNLKYLRLELSEDIKSAFKINLPNLESISLVGKLTKKSLLPTFRYDSMNCKRLKSFIMSDFNLTGTNKVNLFYDIKSILDQGVGTCQLETLHLKNVFGISTSLIVVNNDLSLLSLKNLRSFNISSTLIKPIRLIDLIRKFDLNKLEYLNLRGSESSLSLEKPAIIFDNEKKLFDIILKKYEYDIRRDGPLNVNVDDDDLDFGKLKKKKKKPDKKSGAASGEVGEVVAGTGEGAASTE